MFGMFLLVQLCNIATEGLWRSNLASIIVSVQHTSLRVHQASGGQILFKITVVDFLKSLIYHISMYAYVYLNPLSAIM